jgi:hypothetical protein
MADSRLITAVLKEFNALLGDDCTCGECMSDEQIKSLLTMTDQQVDDLLTAVTIAVRKVVRDG